jgi:hypothetical protein
LLLQYSWNAEYIKRNTARALERGYRLIKLHERTPAAVAAAREVTGPELPTAEVEVPRGPGLSADPEDDLIAGFKV